MPMESTNAAALRALIAVAPAVAEQVLLTHTEAGGLGRVAADATVATRAPATAARRLANSAVRTLSRILSRGVAFAAYRR